MKHLIFIYVLLISSSVYASESEAIIAFKNGNFEKARIIGQETGTTNSLMVACRAGMLIGGYQQSGSLAVQSLHTAIQDCHRAVSMNPNHMNARITLAIAVGFEGKRWKKPAYAKLSRAILEQVYVDFPQAPSAHAAVGGWHSEVSAAGFLARVYLGASRSKAKLLFADAAAMGETDLPFVLEHLKLMARGGRSDRKKAALIIAKNSQPIPDNALDEIMHKNLALIDSALKSNNKKRIKKAIAETTAFNGIDKWRNIPLLDLAYIKQSLKIDS